MKILIAGSMQLSEKMLALVEELKKLGFDSACSKFAVDMVGKTDEEKEVLKMHQKFDLDAMSEFFEMMKDAGGLLVANYDKGGKKNYIGANTFLEMGVAYCFKQKIFLLNPIPDNPFYQSEIKAMRPIVISGDLTKIKKEMEGKKDE